MKTTLNNKRSFPFWAYAILFFTAGLAGFFSTAIAEESIIKSKDAVDAPDSKQNYNISALSPAVWLAINEASVKKHIDDEASFDKEKNKTSLQFKERLQKLMTTPIGPMHPLVSDPKLISELFFDALEKGHYPTLAYLALSGVKTVPGKFPLPILNFLAIYNQAEALYLILSNNNGLYDINAPTPKSFVGGFTPIHSACFYGSIDSLLVLLNFDPDLNATTDLNHWTPLHIGAMMGNKVVVQSLLEAGASTQIEDVFGALPAHYVVMRSDSTIADLLKNAKDFNKNNRDNPDLNGWTPSKKFENQSQLGKIMRKATSTIMNGKKRIIGWLSSHAEPEEVDVPMDRAEL
jgi:hypothetical protein